MAWRETDPVDERMEFIAGYLRGEASITSLCDAFGISRKTGYKWIDRYEALGPVGLLERSHSVLRCPHRTPGAVTAALLSLRRETGWGPKKLRVLLAKRYPELAVPAVSTVGELLKQHGLVKPCPQRRRKQLRRATPLSAVGAPNDCWSADHKGHFELGDSSRCYPLTITDNYSRYLLRCVALTGIDSEPAQRVFEQAFKEYGLPLRIRTDNGSPFGANRGLAISKLSLWWMRLGIQHERISAGQPQQNGRHERMHRTLKETVCSPPGRSRRAQQQRFESFVRTFNHDRPHEALGMSVPADVYCPSNRPLPRHLQPLTYPDAFDRRRVGENGRINIDGTSYFVTKVLVGEDVGLQHLDEDSLRLWAGHLPLGVFHLRLRRFTAYDEAMQLDAA